ncbi:uncharacterized protein FA14DRAFT_160269 [Meira miltonrushii]|uniref:Uncharacterized protein n=1 Tax=Meira miltonrushii TaxID=1280837 RepID=A0A316VBB6_9BASI|nr:uncharacterized protein FA14DRAFT_160269 [Meira miltonrushii]PWN34832.1 hypothetical protein FA14DRAFT_160269 [Meira miltonrushii]
MAKGRHGKPQPKKGGFGAAPTKTKIVSEEAIFKRAPHTSNQGSSADSPLLLTLLFRDKASQHSALARIESFYESSAVEGQSNDANRFLTIDQAKSQKLCPNYEAFNCPISAVNQWLGQMFKCPDLVIATPQKEEESSIDDSTDQPKHTEKWWQTHCNEEEVELLSFLDFLGCLEDPANPIDKTTNGPQYLITSLASQAASSLPHERLHFLYFASKEYREYVESLYGSLSNKTRKIIETDLGMRGYAKHVWQDEFQAYVSLNAAEFGNPTKQECTPIKEELQQKQKQLLIWKHINTTSV